MLNVNSMVTTKKIYIENIHEGQWKENENASLQKNN